MQDGMEGVVNGNSTLELTSLQEELREKRKNHSSGMVTVKSKPQADVVPPSQVSKVLFVARGVWPFDFYPDELIIEEKRIVVKKNYFPFGGSILSLPIKRLYTFELINSIFFSSIHIKGEALGNADIRFAWLKHKDALEAKNLVDGLKIKENESVEIYARDKEALTRVIEAMGET